MDGTLHETRRIEGQSPTSKPRLWLVCELYFPEVNATGHYATQIGSGLAGEFDVNVICAQPNYLSKGIKAPARDVHEGADIYRVWSTTLNKNVLLFRLINMFTVGLSMFIASIRHFRRGDRVLVVTAPPSLPYSTALAALFRGGSYVVLLHDLYPDILVAVGKTNSGSFLFNTVERLNRWLYKHARRIIVVGRDMNDRVARKAAGLDVPIVTIPNWSDLEAIEPAPKGNNPLLRNLDLQEKFVLMYAGNIGHPTDIQTIVDSAAILLDDPEVHFVFVGSGAKLPWLKNEVASRNLTNVSILGQLPREQQNDFLNACDVALISLVPGMLGTAMPSRTYNAMAAGKPILALTEDGSELSQVIDELDIGWHTAPGYPDELVELIKTAMGSGEELLKMGRRARLAAESVYSPSIAVEKYSAVMRG
jgi:colanic acid biosynthesis glycosyl transferase WcaI